MVNLIRFDRFQMSIAETKPVAKTQIFLVYSHFLTGSEIGFFSGARMNPLFANDYEMIELLSLYEIYHLSSCHGHDLCK